MLRITAMIAAQRTVLKVEGTLAGPWVAELKSQIDAVSGPVALDLAGVSFMDAAGAELVEKARGQGAEIIAASHFVSLMLEKSDQMNSPSGKEE